MVSRFTKLRTQPLKMSLLILEMPFKVRIKEWRTFASWHWETGDEKQCGICRNPFDAICGTGDCNQPGDKCPMISGKCAHKFHYHCIRKWLSVSRSPLNEKNERKTLT